MNSYQLVAHLLNTAHGVVIHAIETFRYQSLVEGWVGVAFALLCLLFGFLMAFSAWSAINNDIEEAACVLLIIFSFGGFITSPLILKYSIPKILNPDFYIYEKVLLK